MCLGIVPVYRSLWESKKQQAESLESSSLQVILRYYTYLNCQSFIYNTVGRPTLLISELMTLRP